MADNEQNQAMEEAVKLDTIPETGTEYDFVIGTMGQLIDVGVSGVVELMASGFVIKYPWPGAQHEESVDDMILEARAYRMLTAQFGEHKRFVKIVSLDDIRHSITMEYMVNGTLRAYLATNNQCITDRQRRVWILALAEGLEMLHSVNIVHCDYSPKNFLLDHDLELKVADFGCVSIDGARSAAGGSVRFYPRRVLANEHIDATDDLFALGSSIFEVLTGVPPYKDLEIEQIQCLYRLNQYDSLVGLEMAEIIRDCWLLRVGTASEVFQRVKAAVARL